MVNIKSATATWVANVEVTYGVCKNSFTDLRVFGSSGHVKFGDYFCACLDANVKSDVCK